MRHYLKKTKRTPYPHPTLPGTIVIPLTRGRIALADAEHLGVVAGNWHASGTPRRCYAAKGAGGRLTLMHRAIMSHVLGRPVPRHLDIDHINGDTLDNRLSNLRVVTRGQNLQNQKLHADSSHNMKGVRWDSRCNKFQVRIRVGGRQICQGYYATLEEAGRAYDESARRYFGDFARTNAALGLLREAA